MGNINKRFKEAVELMAGSQINYANKVGSSPQVINGYCCNKGIGILTLKRLLELYPDVNTNYIITGKGDIITKKEHTDIEYLKKELEQSYSEIDNLKQKINLLSKENEMLYKRIINLKIENRTLQSESKVED